jgi:hypothetical protein
MLCRFTQIAGSTMPPAVVPELTAWKEHLSTQRIRRIAPTLHASSSNRPMLKAPVHS